MYVFLFTDIEGSTRLWEEHTPVMKGIIARHDEILRGQIEAHGGRIANQAGDGITSGFRSASRWPVPWRSRCGLLSRSNARQPPSAVAAWLLSTVRAARGGTVRCRLLPLLRGGALPLLDELDAVLGRIQSPCRRGPAHDNISGWLPA